MILDIHSHILPGVDDGAKDVEESLELLKMSYNQGIRCVVATSHFDANEDNIESFKESTEAALKKISDNAKAEIPEIYLGSEVFYFHNIGNSAGIRELTLGNTDYILIELPFCDIDNHIIKDVAAINTNLGLMPVLAHLERYSKLGGFRRVLDLVDSGICKAQINSSSVLYDGYQKTVCKLIGNGLVSFVASDMHSVKHRPPMIKPAMDTIASVFGNMAVEKIERESDYLYRQLTGKDDFNA